MDYRDMFTRAAWTAAETFLAVLIPVLVAGVEMSTVKVTLASAAIAALAAALTVVKEAIKSILRPL